MSLVKDIDSLMHFAQKVTVNNDVVGSHNTPPSNLMDLSNFVHEEDLIQPKGSAFFKGHFGDPSKPSIIIIRASTPKTEKVKQVMSDFRLTSTGRFGKGFGYYKANCIKWQPFSVDIIYPWTEPEDEQKETKEEKEKRIKDQTKIFNKFHKRYKPQRRFIVRETPEMYKNITLKKINSFPKSSLKWVYDILDGKRESERVLIQDDHKEIGFVSCPDSKWKSHPKVDNIPKSEWKLNKSIPASLYILTLVRDRTIRSIRDLRGKHIGLLENLFNKTVKAIKDIYDLDRNLLRIFVHYQPQYYHFHIHFTTLATDCGINVEKAILLEDVIDNLKMNSNYYAEANITCVVNDGDELLN